MTEIRFYHLEQQSLEQVLPALLSKALENGHRILVKTSDDHTAERLNEYLWTYNPNSFLPHGSKKDGNAEQQPIWLTSEENNPNEADVLILTNGATSDSMDEFKLCCELFDGRDPNIVSEARTRWKAYQEADHDLTYWQQGTNGWEKKSG